MIVLVRHHSIIEIKMAIYLNASVVEFQPFLMCITSGAVASYD